MDYLHWASESELESESESESESALFAKCVQTHKEFVVVFKNLLVHTHTYIHIWHENRNI